MNLLAWFKFPVGDGAFYAVFGFVFVFLGITLLILFFTLFGMVMKRVNARGENKRQAAREKAVAASPVTHAEEGIPPEVVAAITAAIAAYYEGEQVKCDFVVRRIKKI